MSRGELRHSAPLYQCHAAPPIFIVSLSRGLATRPSRSRISHKNFSNTHKKSLTSPRDYVKLNLRTEEGCNFFVWSFKHGYYEIDENENYVRVYRVQKPQLRQLQK